MTKKLFRTHSHELHIKGAGFPEDEEVQLKFSPPLEEGTDYSVEVISRTELEVTLNDGKAWSQSAGALQVTAINTRGDSSGWIQLPGENGVHIAQVVDDEDSESTGGIEVFPMGVQVYKSALSQKVAITGIGFSEGMRFNFESDLKNGVDYDQQVESKNRVVLRLKSGKAWNTDNGMLIVKSIVKDGKTFNLAGGEGIRVAVVLENPSITSENSLYHESQSKLIVISGSGFTDTDETNINLRPTPSTAYKILNVLDDAIRIQLLPDQDWLPSYTSLSGEDDSKKIELQVTSINTGAGNIAFDDPVTIGYIIKDREGVTCDDSCEFAFDGVCDDGSEPNDQYYYQNYNNYMDDDFGGFYDEEADFDGDGEEESYGEMAYDDYYMENEDYQVSACVEGTDCTDCGGVDAIIDYSKPLSPDSGITICDNTCIYPRDGVCDDARGTKYCELGTDCQDCGPVGADNFTDNQDDGWWDDDDDYWAFNDGNFLDQTKGLEANRAKVKVYHRDDSGGSAAMFLVILEGIVYTIGAVFAAAALYLLNRWYKGQSMPFMSAFDPEMNQKNFELAPMKRVPLTPDVIRT